MARKIAASAPKAPVALQPLGASGLKTMRNDAWYNYRNQLGGARDPVTVTQFIASQRLGRAELDALYRFSGLAGRIVDLLPAHATRAWIKLHHEKDPKKAEALAEEADRVNLSGLIEEAWKWGRLHGGCGLVFGAWDGRAPDEPLEIERVRKVLYAYNVERWLTYPLGFYRDPMGGNFGQVETYQISRLSPVDSQLSPLHETRMIRFGGQPTTTQARIQNFGWDDPVLQRPYDAVRNYGMAMQAAAGTVQSFVMLIFTLQDLKELISNRDFETINARMSEMIGQLSVNNATFLGEGEKVEKLGTPLEGLANLLDKLQAHVASETPYPKSVLFQAESGTMGGNAAETDLRNWYSYVQSQQENYLRPRLRRALDIIGVPIGLKPGEVTFSFNPLYTLSELQQAEVYSKAMEGDSKAIAAGIVDDPARIAIHRFGGDHFNYEPPAYDTARQEAYLKELDATPIEMPLTMEEEAALRAEAGGGEPERGEGLDESGAPEDGGNGAKPKEG